MNDTNTPALTALRLLFASETADLLFTEIEDIYCREIEAAKGRTVAIAKKLIEGQLQTLPTLTFGIDSLTDQNLETLASGFIPDGVTFD